MDEFFLETLSSGKKVSLFSAVTLVVLMLTAFAGVMVTQRGNGYDWVGWVGFFATFPFALCIIMEGIDFSKIGNILRLVTVAVVMLSTIALIMDFSGVTGGRGGVSFIFSFLMFLMASFSAAGVLIIDLTTEHKFNLSYCLMAGAFLIIAIFLIVCEASSVFKLPLLGLKIAFVMATLALTAAAVFKTMEILKD